jgi:hypothetical protein
LLLVPASSLGARHWGIFELKVMPPVVHLCVLTWFFHDLQWDVLNNSAFGRVCELSWAVYCYARWWGGAHRAEEIA